MHQGLFLVGYKERIKKPALSRAFSASESASLVVADRV